MKIKTEKALHEVSIDIIAKCCCLHQPIGWCSKCAVRGIDLALTKGIEIGKGNSTKIEDMNWAVEEYWEEYEKN